MGLDFSKTVRRANYVRFASIIFAADGSVEVWERCGYVFYASEIPNTDRRESHGLLSIGEARACGDDNANSRH
jgi:hypothetical protein